MASTIDIFNKKAVSDDKILESKVTNNYTNEELLQLSKKQEKFLPNVDYSDPKNFARFGSAEEYYKNSIKYISQEYPFDGSLEEKIKWSEGLTDFEYYIFSKEYPRSVGYANLSAQNYIKVYSHVKDPISYVSTDEIYNYKKYSDTNLLILSSSVIEKPGICLESWARFSPSMDNKFLTVTALSTTDNISFTNVDLVTLKASASNFYVSNRLGNEITLNYTVPTSEWHHYAFNIKSGSVQLFVDGNLVEENNSLSFNDVCTFTSKGLFLQDILTFDDNADVEKQPVFTICSGSNVSIDDIRLWNNTRTVEEIGRNWFLNVDRRVIDENQDSNLLFYFKFNEGWDPELGYLCLDYSGRKNHSQIVNYNSACRTDSSAIDDSSLCQDLEKPEIIVSGLEYSTVVTDFYNEKILLGKDHDSANMHLLYNKFPSWLIEEEEEFEDKNLKKIIQIICSYFDDLYNKIKELSDLKSSKYTSDMDRVYPFYDKILTSMGFDVTDIFSNLTSIQKISSREDKTLYDEEIQKVKNVVFQNIYNNLLYIFKSKGTEKSLRSFLRSYGISEDLVRINLYADKTNFGAVDKSRETVVKKKTITMSDSSSIYLSSSAVPDENYFTLETSLMFPQNLKENAPTEVSLFGISNSLYDYYVTVKQEDSKNYKFILHESNSSGILSESVSYTTDNLYDNSVWNLALRKKSHVDKLYDGVAPGPWNIELYCCNYNTLPTVQISCSMEYFNDDDLKYYIGARKTDLTGSLEIPSNSKYLYCNFWSSDLDNSGYLSNDEIKSHNMDILNYGVN